MNKQGKNGIGWTDYTWNPSTGCLNNCRYCYAAKIGKRFQGHFKPMFHPERLEEPYKLKKPSKIFVCSMSDLFGEWIPPDVIEKVIQVARENPRHTFQFLTKNPNRYADFDFPKNCWLGATATKETDNSNVAFDYFLPECKCFYVSYEPLLGYIDTIPIWLNWIIIGAMTGKGSKKYQPKLEWIENIVRQAKNYKIPIFMKRSLQGIWKGELIRQFPAGAKNRKERTG